MENICNCSAFISALAALIALGFSIYVFFNTRKRLKPLERPFFEIKEQKTEKGKLHIQFINLGNHPAEDLLIEIGSCRKDKIKEFKKIGSYPLAGKIPSNTIFTWDAKLDEESYYYLLFKYKDPHCRNKKYMDEFWRSFGLEAKSLGYMSIKEKEKLEPFVNKVFPERIKMK